MFTGILFILQIGLLAYLWFADPFQIRPMLSNPSMNVLPKSSGTDQNPGLSAEQESFLTSIGIDPASLPTEIDEETESCLRSKVSPERAAEIEAGATPTPLEIFKAKECL